MAITIKDIAKKSGVSRATVSRVLNNSGYVKEETRQNILEIMNDLNYTPSAIARSLSTNKTNTIGVIIPQISDPFFGDVIRGISEVATTNDLNIFLCNTDDDAQKELKFLEILQQQRIQGIIITPTLAKDKGNKIFLKKLNDLGIPIILVDGFIKYNDFSGVFIDHVQGGFDATNALIEEGHKKIAIITGRMDTRPGRERFEGYKEALLSNDIKLEDKYVMLGDFSYESAYNITKEILELEDRPTAIFVTSNMMILGCIKALNEYNLKIPEDISIIGFDKIDVLNIIGMSISSVNGPTHEIGRIAINMLIDALNSKDNKIIKRTTLKPELALKGSEKYINKSEFKLNQS